MAKFYEMNLKTFFSINQNTKLKRWEFMPNKKVNSTSYMVSFYEADNESDAWISLFMGVKKSPDFYIRSET